MREAQQAAGKPVKKRRAGVKRRKKPGSSDAIRAVLLAAALIAAAAFISAIVIIVRSSLNTQDPGTFPPLAAGGSEVQEQPPPFGEPSVGEAPAKEPFAAPARPAPAGTSPAAPASVQPASAQPAKPAAVRPPAAPTRPAPARPAPARSAPAPAETSPYPAAARSAPPVERPPLLRRGSLAFVIDDAGNNLRELEPFLRIPGPLTIAVLPGLPNSAEAARRIRAAGKEVFLHQPMEAIGGQNPGPGAIYAGMSAADIRAVLERNVAEIGPIAGMNNHQGSKITMNEAAMETILAFCREKGLYFLDSRTTAETTAPAAARRLGIKIGERDVFIDNIQEKSSMIRYIDEGLVRAERRGHALMIGHTWSPELAPVLSELYPGFLEKGYSLSTASGLIMDSVD